MRKHKYKQRAMAAGVALTTLGMMAMTSVIASATASETMTLEMQVPGCTASISNLSSGDHDQPTFDESKNSILFSFDQASLDWSAGDPDWCEGILEVESDEVSSDPNRTLLFVSRGQVDSAELVDNARVKIDEGPGGLVTMTIDAYVSINYAGSPVTTVLTFMVTPS